MKSLKFTIIFVAVLIASMLWACQETQSPVDKALSFNALIEGESMVLPENSTQSGITVVSDSSQLSDTVVGIVDEKTLEALKKSIEGGQLVVIVNAPEQSTSGYRIQVESIVTQGNTVKVVTSTGPTSDQAMGNQVLSYPYQIITVEKSKIPANANWEMDNSQASQPIQEQARTEVPTQEVVERKEETEPIEKVVIPTLDVHKDGFTTLARGDTPVIQATIENPTMLITNKFKEVEAYLPASMDPTVVEQLKKAPDEGNLILVVYRGMMSTSGYGIEVQSIVPGDKKVTVTVMLSKPGGQAANDVISYPYEILLVSTAKVPAMEGTAWVLVDTDGNQLAEISYP